MITIHYTCFCQNSPLFFLFGKVWVKNDYICYWTQLSWFFYISLFFCPYFCSNSFHRMHVFVVSKYPVSVIITTNDFQCPSHHCKFPVTTSNDAHGRRYCHNTLSALRNLMIINNWFHQLYDPIASWSATFFLANSTHISCHYHNGINIFYRHVTALIGRGELNYWKGRQWLMDVML